MSRIRNGQSGYSGLVRRHGAVEAELVGKLLLSRAIARLARDAGTTPRKARAVLESLRASGAAPAGGPTERPIHDGE